MKQSAKAGKSGHRRGGFFTPLAALLLIVTVIGFIVRLSGTGDVESALEKTAKALKEREAAAVFLLDALKEGGLEATGSTLKIRFDADHGAASLSMTGTNKDFSFTAAKGNVTMQSRSLWEKALSADGKDAPVLFRYSVLNEDFVRSDDRAAAQWLLLLSDPALWDTDSLTEAAAAVFRKADPVLTRESGKWQDGEKKIDVTDYRYTFDSAALVRAMGAFRKQEQSESVRSATLAALRVLYALSDGALTAEKDVAAKTFLAGDGADFDAFSNLLGKSQSLVTLCFSVRGGAVIGVKAEWDLGEHHGSLSLFLGEEIASSANESFSLTLSRGGEMTFSLTADCRVKDDSDTAFIREMKISLFDRTGFFRPADSPDSSATVLYSWGRAKGDLGLKISTPDNEANLRGTLESWREGSRLTFRLNRVEVNGSKRVSEALDCTLTAKGEPTAAPASQGALFPEGEEKDALRETVRQNYVRLFGEAS